MQVLGENEVVIAETFTIRKIVQGAFSNQKINSSDMIKYNKSRQDKEQNFIAR